MRWFFLLLSFSVHLSAGSFNQVTPSTPDEIASLSSDLLVDGFVSALSGQISLTETDLHIKSAQDLTLKRIYVPPQILGRYEDKDEKDRWYLGNALCQLHTKGWVVAPHLFAGYNRKSPYFQLRDPQGYVLEFQIEGNQGILKTSSYGCSNLRGGGPNSAADIRNIEFWMEDNQARVIWPDGTERVYLRKTLCLYCLSYELLPNGKRIQYKYTGGGLYTISSTDTTGRYAYASIDKVGPFHYKTSDGNEVHLRGRLQSALIGKFLDFSFQFSSENGAECLHSAQFET